jgi:hypothetical protein
MQRYSLSKIKDLELHVSIYEFSDETLNIINNIAKQVGAPNYVKTPTFIKKKKQKNVAPPRPVIEESEKEKCMKQIQSILNKFSINTYDKLKSNLIELIKSTLECADTEITYEEINKKIFEIASKQKINVQIFAKLYKELISVFPLFHEHCLKICENYLNMFENIIVVSPEDNYEEFCKMNVENEKRRCISSFYSELLLMDILDIDYIVNLINQLFIKLFEEGKTCLDNNACIEYSENLFLLITKSHEKLTQSSSYTHILENIGEIKNIDKIVYSNITSKIKFKFMDMYDFINKKQ